MAGISGNPGCADHCCHGSSHGKDRYGNGNGYSGDFQKPSETQQKIDQMGNEKADKVPVHAIPWQQKVKKDNIHTGCQNIIAHAGCLLSQTFCHGIRQSITVQHGHQNSIALQIISGLCTFVQFQTKGFSYKEHETAKEKAIQHSDFQTSFYKITDPVPTTCGGTPGQFRNQ